MRVLTLTAALIGMAFSVASAQSAPPQRPPNVPIMLVASSFSTTEVRLTGRSIHGGWYSPATMLEGPSRISISYGQPHLRGRTMGAVVPRDSVWRIGANMATELRTDADLSIGGTTVPRGVYSLFALPTSAGWQLIISKQIGMWGTDYDRSADLARIPLRAKNLNESVEALSIYLVPTQGTMGMPDALTKAPAGTLKIVWDKTELSADWEVLKAR
jgi:hypothetical protein